MYVEEGQAVPAVTFQTREDGDWKQVTSYELFGNKKVVLFALPGAFTPTCSTFQLPGFESMYSQFQEAGIDDIYCLSVNDTFVMNAWFKELGIEKVKPLPDGSRGFTASIGANVQKDNLGFGLRSWRYAIVVNDGVIEKVFTEEGQTDDIDSDPYEVSSPENVLENI